MIQTAAMAVSTPSMKKNSICILAAGRGTRLGDYTKVFNKAMLPLHGKAVISHIIEKFPEDSHFTIALGYKGAGLKDYIELAHEGLDVTYVTVPDYDGPGSGPGASLLCCREALADQPFYFVTCDSYWTVPISGFSTEQSWVAADYMEQSKTSHYCLLDVKDGLVTGLKLKQPSVEPVKEVFTGLAYIKDTEIFWNSLEGVSLDLGEKQVTEPFQVLARQGKLRCHLIDWVDTGLIESYQNELRKNGQYDFSKTKEALYLVSGHVIKYFDNPKDSEQRVTRAKLNPKAFPEITGYRKNMYRYRYQPGHTLYEDDRPEVFTRLLPWLEKNLWQPQTVDNEKFRQVCDAFYREKTLGRIEQFKQKYTHYRIDTVNGAPVPSVEELLTKVDWPAFQQGVPSFIHGDLQPDNIIYNSESDSFLLLDWRQNFAGEVAFGDLYYDFAKLWGGLNLNYKEVKNNAFTYSEEAYACTYGFNQHRHFEELSQKIENLAYAKALSIPKIRVLVGLIYLNMSPLHHYPFDKMLYALGRKVLFEALD